MHVATDKSSYLCFFHPPWSRKQFLRMPFGITSATEVIQKRNEQTFSDIAGVYVITASPERKRLAVSRQVIERDRARGMKCNLNKMQFKVSVVEQWWIENFRELRQDFIRGLPQGSYSKYMLSLLFPQMQDRTRNA